jgi:hypothetical protein
MGDHARHAVLMDSAELCIGQIGLPRARQGALAQVIGISSAGEDHTRMARLLRDLEALTRESTRASWSTA